MYWFMPGHVWPAHDMIAIMHKSLHQKFCWRQTFFWHVWPGQDMIAIMHKSRHTYPGLEVYILQYLLMGAYFVKMISNFLIFSAI